MTSWREMFNFRRAPYLRPNEIWACGRAAQGAPCRLGPGALGRCRTRTECDPIFSQGEWVCTRSAELGRKCEDGPSGEGVCCRTVAKCVPVRNLRSLRGRVTFWVFAATLLGLVAALGTDLRFRFFDPGQVIQAHSGVTGCETCHAVGQAHVGAWFGAAWAPDDTAATSGKCLNCHDRGDHPLRPHSMSPGLLSQISESITTPSGGLSAFPAHIANGTLFDPPESTGGALACAACHKDHKGLHFNPNVVSNGRCQTCHKQQFASLEDGHPSFGDYPYLRRSRIAFDHNKHFKQHFDQAKGQPPPKKCANCHEPDPTSRYMVVMPFERTCGSCHMKDIEGTGLAGAKGIPVFGVPGLDTKTLRARGLNVGQWPGDADAEEMSPFVRTLLAADARLDEDMRRLKGVDLQDLSGADKPVLAAAYRVAWGYKELLYELGRHGGEAVQVRLANGFGIALDRPSVGRLVGNIPREVIRAAQARWFPRLAREVARHRKRRAGLIIENPTSHASRSDRGSPQNIRMVQVALAGPAEPRMLLRLGLSRWLFGALAPPAGSPEAARSDRQPVQLAQRGDLLNGNANLIDKSSLRMKEYKELQREDRGANNSDFKKGGSSGSTAKRRRAPPKKEPRAVARKTPKNPPASEPEPVRRSRKPARSALAGNLLGGGSKLIDKSSLRMKEYKELQREDGGANNSIFRKGGSSGSAASGREEPPEEEPKAVAKKIKKRPAKKESVPAQPEEQQEERAGQPDPAEKPMRKPARPDALQAHMDDAPAIVRRPKLKKKLGPPPDSEEWARTGGWYRVDFTLFYRPAAHKDAFMKSWLDVAAATHGGSTQPYGERLLAIFRSSDTVGKCVRCHSVDQVGGGQLAINWRPFTPDPEKQTFTVFNHATHFSMAGERGCQTCHQLNPMARFAIAYRGLDPTSFESNFFAPIKRETCAECHVPESAGNACIQCHRYHVGEFASAPIVTEIAKRATGSSGARPGRAPRAIVTRTPPEVTKRAPRRSPRGPKPALALPPTDAKRFPVPKRKPVIHRGRTSRKAAGAYGVRLGSYLSRTRARNSLRLLSRTVAAFLDGKKLKVETSKIRGRVIYRVIARPYSKREAEGSCRRIAAKHSIRCRVTR